MNHGSHAEMRFRAHCIVLNGEYDLSRKDELGSLFASYSADRHAIVDLSRVSFIDSMFLCQLTLLHRRFKSHGVTLAAPQSAVRRVLYAVSFDELFAIAETKIDALERLSVADMLFDCRDAVVRSVKLRENVARMLRRDQGSVRTGR